MIKGAIFDMDGTLLDSMGLWDRMGEDYLRSLGYEPREGVNEKFKSLSLYDAACWYRSEYGVTLPAEQIVSEIDALAERFYSTQAEAKPGAADFLQKLRDRGVKMCIATSTDRHLVELALRRTGLLGFFSKIFTCTEVGHGKSEPHVYRAAMEHLSTRREDTWVFEDAYFAIRTLKADGFKAAAVADIHQDRQDGIRALADWYMDDLTDFEGFWRFQSTTL